MTGIAIRLAAPPDIHALVEMRRDFTFEDPEVNEGANHVGFEADCADFLEDAISSGRWHIWVAELDGRIVSHAFVALIDKVPRPVRGRVPCARTARLRTSRTSTRDRSTEAAASALS